jgi:3-methyl-2-oxobutanoate hydroxymethyltransferase
MTRLLRELKGHRKITALTAYDYPMAQILSKAGVDILLVGDSLGMVVLGYTSTHFVTMEDMIRHTQAVMRGHSGLSLVVADMPIGSCDSIELALKNCRRMVDETGVRAVKIEGVPDICRAVVDSGIEVMGHTGLKPQTAERMKVKGKSKVEFDLIIQEAKDLQEAGCFSIVLEAVPSALGKEVTSVLSVPTIGIGAGPDCDGQILVVHDLIGMFTDFKPKFVKRYGDVGKMIGQSVAAFKEEVEQGIFPSPKESY